MKFSLSYKHFLLLLGVVVAMIIAITAFNEVQASQEQESSTKSPDERKLNLSIFSLKI